MNKNVTIKQLVELMEEDYQTVSALVKLLVSQEVVKEVGKQVMPAGTKGKPATVYSVPNEVELVFWEDDEKAESVGIPSQKEFDGNEAENVVKSNSEIAASADAEV